MTLSKTSYDSAAEETAQGLQETCLCDLVARIAGRDQTALGLLYDSSSKCVYGLARRITGEEGAAQEVVADAYLQVWQQAERYNAARGRVMAWLLTICRSRALDWRRRQDQALTHPEPEQLRPDLYEVGNEPVDVLQATQRNHRVHAALARLDETPRRLLTLAFFKGLTHQEIAAYTGMPLGSIKSLLRKAMSILKDDLIQASVSPKDFT